MCDGLDIQSLFKEPLNPRDAQASNVSWIENGGYVVSELFHNVMDSGSSPGYLMLLTGEQVQDNWLLNFNIFIMRS